MLLPRANAAEARVVDGLKILPVDSLLEAVDALNQPLDSAVATLADKPRAIGAPPKSFVAAGASDGVSLDFSEVIGQGLAKRALEVAAAGAHNVLLVGAPGGGKTMMARRLAGILPPLAFDEALECTCIHSVAGTLPAAIGANSRGQGIICPKACGPEAAWAGEDIDILAPQTIIQILNHLKGTQVLSRPRPGIAEDQVSLPDFKDIKGQEAAKRALEVAAAGGHHLLMVGPPGAGKSMLAQRLPSILPPMDAREMLEVSMVASLAGELAGGKLSRRRPFRRRYLPSCCLH